MHGQLNVKLCSFIFILLKVWYFLEGVSRMWTSSFRISGFHAKILILHASTV